MLPKGPYQPAEAEPAILKNWLERKLFKPEYDPQTQTLVSTKQLKQDGNNDFVISWSSKDTAKAHLYLTPNKSDNFLNVIKTRAAMFTDREGQPQTEFEDRFFAEQEPYTGWWLTTTNTVDGTTHQITISKDIINEYVAAYNKQTGQNLPLIPQTAADKEKLVKNGIADSVDPTVRKQLESQNEQSTESVDGEAKVVMLPESDEADPDTSKFRGVQLDSNLYFYILLELPDKRLPIGKDNDASRGPTNPYTFNVTNKRVE